MDHALEARNLSKNYTGEHALKGVSVTVPAGSLFGIIGADGAGKTTLLKTIATLLTPDSGDATLLGYDIASRFRDVRSRIGYMPQRFSLYEDLTVIENMTFFADLFGVAGHQRRERTERLLSFSRLGPFRDRRARNLSGGMKQKLALSCALIHTPQLLILDEPTTGVDPLSRQEFWSILRDLHQDGITIIVSTPYMTEAAYCTDLMLLHEGTVLRTGNPASLVAECPITTLRIYSTEYALNVAHAQRDLGPFGAVYPVSGALHVALPRGASYSPDAVLARVRELEPRAEHVEPIEASVEDLFFHYLTTVPGRDAAVNTADDGH